MNLTLFKATTKSNWQIGFIIFSVMLMYMLIIISMYDPEGIAGLNAVLETLPRELVAALGYDLVGQGLTAFIGSYYYGFIAIMFPMIYSIIVANRLVAKHVDSGAMAYLLSTPNSRVTIVTTQAVYLIISVTVLIGLITVAGILISQYLAAGQLDWIGFLRLNLVTLFIFYAISGICFFFSCFFNDTKLSLGFGAGVPIAFFVISMLSNVSEQYAWIGNFSIFTLMNPGHILAGDHFAGVALLILTGVSLITYFGGI